MKLSEAEAFILKELRTKLSNTLYYHSLGHVMDVADAVVRIAKAEGIRDEETLTLLRTAALFHDAGFIKTYQGHEEESCRIIWKALPQFEYTPDQIKTICGMIRATRIPQAPETKLEEILCDADLDYLGRHDFETIANYLYRELKERGLVGDERSWNRIQIEFMENHQYWSRTARRSRQPMKDEHLCRLREIVKEKEAQ
jgi:uncharacterized protein